MRKLYGVYKMYAVQTGEDDFHMDVDYAIQKGYETREAAEKHVQHLVDRGTPRAYLHILNYEVNDEIEMETSD